MKLSSLALLGLALSIASSTLLAQGVQLTNAINANLVIILPGAGIGATPSFAPAGGVADVETGIRNVRAALIGGAVGAQVISVTINGINITWSHDAGNVGVGGDGEIAFATGPAGGGGGAGGDVTVTITNDDCAGYAVAGHGTAGNDRGRDAVVNCTGIDCVAEPSAGDGFGNGRGGDATGTSSVGPGGGGTDVGTVLAVAGISVGAVRAGHAIATADGDAVAVAGSGDVALASTGGDATATTINGAGVGATSNATAGNGGTTGGHSERCRA